MTFTPITHQDNLLNATRVGGAGYILNVNAGSKVPPTLGRANRQLGNACLMDMCWHQGELHVVHCEIDSSVSYLGTYAFRGPYVHRWDGAAWHAVGGEIDPGAAVAPVSIGDRWRAIRPRIASDGTDLFISYTDTVITNVGSGAGTKTVYIAAWSGAAWSDVASRAFSDGSMTFAALCIKAGLAYCAYYENNATVTVLRSDGTFTNNIGVSGSIAYAAPNGGAVAVVVNRAGRPVGFYNIAPARPSFNITRAVMFDLDTGVTIQETATLLGPSPMVPYGTNHDNGIDVIAGIAALYDVDQLIVSDAAHGALVCLEDGSGPMIALGGDDYLYAASVPSDGMPLVVDPGDARNRQIWTLNGNSYDPGDVRGPDDIVCWQPGCSASFVVGNPANEPPQYQAVNRGGPVPFPDIYIVANSLFWNYYGPASMVIGSYGTGGDSLYVGVLYEPDLFSDPGPSPAQQFWSQFIVYEFPIVRDSINCAAYNNPMMRTAFKAAQ